MLLSPHIRHNVELYLAIDEWMVYYNNRRRHSSIGQCSPIDFEAMITKLPEAA
jgi:transposase InsO family protein